MTNREKYKQAFSALNTSDNFILEVEKMKQTSKRYRLKTVVALVAAFVMIVGGATTAYAMDIGGIQRTIQLWIHGDQTEVTIQFDGAGNYNMQYTDSKGNAGQQGGGGVAIGEDGTERPLTEEELTEHMTRPEVEYKDDGTVWVYWYDQTIEITDRFENDICYVQLVHGEETWYMAVKYENGYSMSAHKYPDPAEFN